MTHIFIAANMSRDVEDFIGYLPSSRSIFATDKFVSFLLKFILAKDALAFAWIDNPLFTADHRVVILVVNN